MPFQQQDSDIVVGLDIGTSKVATIVGRRKDSNDIEVIGFSKVTSKGLKSGEVIDIAKTTEAIRNAINEAEKLSDYKISRVYVGISDIGIKSYYKEGNVIINTKEVTEQDIERAVENAKAGANYDNQKEQVIHVLPHCFSVDDQHEIKNPAGIEGSRFKASVNIITAQKSKCQNIIKCVEKCQLSVEQIVLSSIATGLAVLTKDEKELGVCLIDIGGGTSDVIIYNSNLINYRTVFPYAGQHVTKDISLGLTTPIEDAEKLKLEHGSCLPQLIGAKEYISVPKAGNHLDTDVTKNSLAVIIKSRFEEIFELISDELNDKKMRQKCTSGIVLSGGGCKVFGTAELAEELFGYPARIGRPSDLIGLADSINEPEFSTAVGLMLFGMENSSEQKPNLANKSSKKIFRLYAIKRFWNDLIKTFQ